MKLGGYRVELETIEQGISEENEVLIDAALDDINLEELRQELANFFRAKIHKNAFQHVAIMVCEE